MKTRSEALTKHRRGSLLAVACLLVAAYPTFADTDISGTPALSSLPGAAYTVYLDFAGFNFNGTWGSSGDTPGTLGAFDGVTGSFSSAEQTRISQVWSSVANAYAPFDINVTTIDPAVAAGQASTDAQRQAYYDSQARMMHTVMTPDGAWIGSPGGISYVGVTPTTTTQGKHTNFDFVSGSGYSPFVVSQPDIHENGHGFGLSHQADYEAGQPVPNSGYSEGNFDGTHWNAVGTYSPIMGAGYYTQRSTWRLGTTPTGSIQNDSQIIANDSGMNGYLADGVGHTLPSATALPITGGSVNASLAKGVITPLSISNPQPIGAANYTQDWFEFAAGGSPVTLTCNDGSDLLTAGVADVGATLRSTMTIYDASGDLVGTATEAASTMSETYSATLASGDYYAEIQSYGGNTQTLSDGNGGNYDTTYYYDMGGYFLTGSGVEMVPEPASLGLLASGMVMLCIRRRR